MSAKVNTLITLFSLLFLQSSEVSSQSIFDLTYPVNDSSLAWDERRFVLNMVSKGQIVKGNTSYWYQSETFCTPTHLGTHFDAPCHFIKDGWYVSDIPVDRLYQRPGYVIDISGKIEASKNPNYLLSTADVEEWLKSDGPIKPGAVILIRTNWSKRWPNRDEYFGTSGSNKTDFNFPGISVASMKLLFDRKIDIYGVGIESPSVDNGPSQDFPTHTFLASRKVYNLENVGYAIGKLPKKDFLITSLPMRIDSACGSPVRIIASLGGGSGGSEGLSFLNSPDMYPYLGVVAFIGMVLIVALFAVSCVAFKRRPSRK